MKLAAFFLIFLSISVRAYEFDGNWNVDKIECLRADSLKPSNYKEGTSPKVTCDEKISKVMVRFAENPDSIEVALTNSLDGERIDVYSFKTFKAPEYYGFGINRRRWEGKLELLNDRTKVSYQELKIDLNHSEDNSRYGDWVYTFDLEKVDSNSYKLVRRYIEFLSNERIDNTQIIYLSR